MKNLHGNVRKIIKNDKLQKKEHEPNYGKNDKIENKEVNKDNYEAIKPNFNEQ